MFNLTESVFDVTFTEKIVIFMTDLSVISTEK